MLTLGTALAQPVVTSALNNASYTLPELPSFGLARGSMVAVFGSRLAADGVQLADSWPLSTTMRGTSAKITVGGTTVDALMAYTTPGQIGIIVPSTTPEGTGTLTVTYNGTSTPFNIRVVRSAFGTFTRNSQGTGPGSVENASQDGRPINALNKPAHPGEVMVLWGTGLGPVTWNEAQPPQAGDLPITIEVWVGGRQAAVSYRGRSGCCAGIDQIAFTVPEGAEGCSVPVVVKTGDIVSNFATIAVAPRGRNACSDPTFNGEDLDRVTTGTYRSGTIALTRLNIKVDVPGVGQAQMNTDTGSAYFSRVDVSAVGSASPSNETQSVSMGGCIVSTFRPTSTGTPPTATFTPLDAGPAINLSGPKGDKQLAKEAQSGAYAAQLGGGMTIPGLPSVPGLPGQQPPYLDAGTYRINNGSGGAGANRVGPFQTSITLAQPLVWTNMDAITAVTRSAGQEVTWTGGDPAGYVIIVGSSTNSSTRVGASFVCTERTTAGRFVIPSYVLLTLPASSGGQTSADALSVMSASNPVKFTAEGLDAGYVMSMIMNSKTLTYR
jgi:uncharacterized protein (TIGR03437 family)